MKVINFNQKIFEEFLERELNSSLNSTEKYLIIGIEEGGMPLAKIVLNNFLKQTIRAQVMGVKCQRPSTKAKKKNNVIKSLIRIVFRILPKFILDFLRNTEHSLLMKKKNPNREVIFRDNIDFNEYNKILIIDDSVDSGFSLQSVVNEIRNKTAVEITTLAVVVTNMNTCIWPDFYLHSNVLIRFPWSLDG